MAEFKTLVTGVGVDGGLNLKAEAQRLAPPAVTRADNAWHIQPGNVQQLPPFYSLYTDAPTPYAFYHLYNISTRDLSPPAPLGDFLVHGEYNDTNSTTDVGNNATGFTRPLWAYNTARTVSYETACLPFSLRLRPLSAPLGISSSSTVRNPTVYGNQLITAREEGTTARRRYLIGAVQNFSVNLTAGYIDGLSRTNSVSYGSNVVSADLIGVQGANYAALLAVGSGVSTVYNISYTGGLVTQFNIATPPNYNAPNAQFVNHAGRTYLVYSGASPSFLVSIRDLVSGNTQQATNTSTSVAPINIAASSPYTHQSTTQVSYLALIQNSFLYILSQDSLGTFRTVGGPSPLPTPAVPVGTGTYNYAATLQAMVADNQGGVGPGAKLVISVFSHFPETCANTAIGTPLQQSVLCTKFAFTAAATNPATSTGTLTQVGANVFRTPAGAGLVTKAFCSNPPEANYAGPVAAKHAMVVVQSGATEADVTSLHKGSTAPSLLKDRESQPTYFIIDQNADIVGRFLEGLAATRPATFITNGSNSGTLNANFPGVQSLASPLFSDGVATDDSSLLTITLPVWGAFISTPQVITSYMTGSLTVPFASRAFFSYTYTPQAATLTFSGQAAGPPAINVGAHTYVSGACPMLHDGSGLVEQNYHFAAHNPLCSGAGSTGDGFVNYYVVYKWYDNQGRQHRSKPSLYTSILTNAGVVPSSTYIVPYINTVKNSVGMPVYAEIYRSVVNNTDDTAYLIDTMLVPSQPKGVGQPTSYVSLAPAAQSTLQGQLAEQPSLYISPNATAVGRTYYTSSPRASFWQVAAKGRCFTLVQVSGQYRVYYSSVASDLFPFEWNDFNYAPVPPDIGDARSVEVVDDKIVVLGTRGNAVMTGDGPASGGAVSAPMPNDGFSPVTPIPVPAGVLGSGSPARIPDGIIYQGYSGIQVIGRDLSIQPAGINVDPLTGRQVGNAGTIYGKGVTLPTLQSVVWPNPRGAPLVYSYLTQKWSTWPLMAGASVFAQKMDGSVWVGVQPISGSRLIPYAPGTAGADVGSLATSFAPISGNSNQPGLVLETPWVLLAGGSTGEADLADMALIGTWQGPHILKVEQAYNYGAYVLTQTLDMTAQPLTYQTRWRPLQNSRVWAVRYRVTLLPITTLNAGYAMAELADLVVYSTPQAGTTRVGQTMTR